MMCVCRRYLLLCSIRSGGVCGNLFIFGSHTRTCNKCVAISVRPRAYYTHSNIWDHKNNRWPACHYINSKSWAPFSLAELHLLFTYNAYNSHLFHKVSEIYLLAIQEWHRSYGWFLWLYSIRIHIRKKGLMYILYAVNMFWLYSLLKNSDKWLLLYFGNATCYNWII